ncbi:MAG TPA: hypothetical protein PLU95_02295 [Syntrophales bacterium]|nr:hypothetical protein [Syntrophales bacterium]HPN08109.1 hypothetical protein [Syntrophales bacterium]HPX81852.1 hypothetical protein [Syntrophales bacterium]
MVPENRIQDGTFPIPKLFVGKEDIDQFTDEFRGFHAQFADCFSREEPRENFVQYMAGQMSQLEWRTARLGFLPPMVGIPLIPPLASEGSRHPVPMQSARGFRFIPPPLVGA